MTEIMSEELIAGFVTGARKAHFLLPIDVERMWSSHEALRQQLASQSAVVEAARAWHTAHYGPVGKAKPSEVLLLRESTSILLADAVLEQMYPEERKAMIDKL